MKALTLHEPWASAIRYELKRIETRSWETSYRGPLLIVAAVKPLKQTLRDVPGWERVALLHALANRQGDGQLVSPGCVVARAVLSDVEPTDHMIASTRERQWGNFDPGRFGWRLEAVEPLPTPIPWPSSKPPACRQRLWTVPEELERLVNAQLDVPF